MNDKKFLKVMRFTEAAILERELFSEFIKMIVLLSVF